MRSTSSAAWPGAVLDARPCSESPKSAARAALLVVRPVAGVVPRLLLEHPRSLWERRLGVFAVRGLHRVTSGNTEAARVYFPRLSSIMASM
jgi:hypothetical protein